MCQLNDDAGQHDLDVSLNQVLSCRIADAKALADCAARKYTVESALRACAGR